MAAFNDLLKRVPDAILRGQLEEEYKQARYKRMNRSAAKPIPMMMTNMPSTLETVRNSHTDEYAAHLYCDGDGKFPTKLTGWEEKTLRHEQEKLTGYYAWLRNYDRKPWSLSIPYKMGGVVKPMFPDFIVARKVGGRIVLDVLEPHRDDSADNCPKAVGLAEYANNHPTAFGRILMIREVSIAGTKVLKALNMMGVATRNKVLAANGDAQLNAIFDSDGIVTN